MTREDYELIDGSLKDAEKDDTPFLITTEDELIVAGDANKTQRNIHDFEITFRIPVEEDGVVKYTTVKKEFKSVYITPRQETRILKMFTAMLPFYHRVNAEGGVEKLSEEEINLMLVESGDEMLDSMYDLVGVVLGIDQDLKDYMLPSSVLFAASNIIHAFPEMVNEAGLFFA